MKDLCARILNFAESEAVNVISAGRCVRPVVETGRPIITSLSLEPLIGPQKVPNSKGAFYLNTGHRSDGSNLG